MTLPNVPITFLFLLLNRITEHGTTCTLSFLALRSSIEVEAKFLMSNFLVVMEMRHFYLFHFLFYILLHRY